MKVVIGLGNPGSQYERTRHNIGWMVLDRLADRAGLSGRQKARDASVTVRGRYQDLDLALVKPTTYMNLSGVAVRKVLARDHVPLEDMLVVVDDFDLPLGRLRLREEGSAGTHNGLRSIVAEMGTQKFARAAGGHRWPRRLGDRPRAVRVRARRAADLELVLDAAADAVESWAATAARAPPTAGTPGGCRRADAAGPPTAPAGQAGSRRPTTPAAPGTPGSPLPDAHGIVRTRTGWRKLLPRTATPGDDRATHLVAWPAGTRPAHRRPGRRRDGHARRRPGTDLGRRRAVTASRTSPRSRGILADDRARSGDLAARADRARVRSVPALRHVSYAGVPHGAKTYLAAALVRATGQRLLWIARDAEIADRAAEELAAWLGDPAAVITLEPRTALAWERSELVRDESASRVATLAAWSAADAPAASWWRRSRRSSSAPCRPASCPREPARAAARPAAVAGPGAARARRPGLRDGARGRRPRRDDPPRRHRGRLPGRAAAARARGVVR